MRFIVFVVFIAVGVISCTSKESANPAAAVDPASSTIAVLCKCGEKYISWQSKTEELAKAGAKKNCESLSLSVSNCQKVK